MEEEKEHKGPRSAALTITELERINTVSAYKAQRVADKIEKALCLSADRDKSVRLSVYLCKGCFYVGGHLAGQAFTQWHCLLCGIPAMHPNTAVPKLCPTCADSFGLCCDCGGDIEMKRRSKFERRIRRKKR